MKKNYIILALLITLTGVTLLSWQKKQFIAPVSYENLGINLMKAMFPTNEQEIITLKSQCIQEAQQKLSALIAREDHLRTFKNTFKEFDAIKNRFLNVSRIIGILPMIASEELSTIAEEQSLLLANVEIELFEQNQALFNALNAYYSKNAHSEKLTPDEIYFMEYSMQGFKNSGLNLTLEQQKEIVALRQKIKTLGSTFQKNATTASNKSLCVTRKELEGISDSFIKKLEQNPDGLYMLKLNFTTYLTILSSCSVSKTREKMYKSYTNRAYPENMDVLIALIESKNKLAHLLDYESAAHLELNDTMAKTPERAEQFLNQLASKIEPLEKQEFQTLIKNLPSNVTLSPEGTLYPWDRTYLMEQHKKNHYSLDEDLIAEYFPLENTLKELFSLYEKFFDLTFHCQPIKELWNPELQIITIYQKKSIIGYVILDLFSRDNKYHNACHTTIITPQLLDNGFINPGASLVIANFDKPQKDSPTLLRRDDVSTIFHEFGHALHALLGAAPFATLSGTNVKRDFVETPSQMLEEWLFDKNILKKISSHYITKEPLPDALIERIVTSKNVNAAAAAQTQIVYSLMSLLFFKDGTKENLHSLFKKIYTKVKPNDFYCQEAHGYLSFTHFITYDAKYYSYVWSKVFALDLFDTIKNAGLLNPIIGIQFKETVLAPGGSRDPNESLKDFLGREPNDVAYLRDLGL